MKFMILTLILISSQMSLAKTSKVSKKCEQCVVDYRECRIKEKSNNFPVSAMTKCELTYNECSDDNKCQ